MHPDLQTLLRQRLDIIADHTFRDSDPDAHLDALKDVSEEIQAYTNSNLASFDGRLRHYLTNSSYQKALDHLADATNIDKPAENSIGFPSGSKGSSLKVEN